MMDLMAADPEKSVMIGDTEKDIIAAGRAGIESIWYNPKVNQAFYGDLDFGDYQPTFTVSDLASIEGFF